MLTIAGINLSVYYSTVIFSQVGLSPFLAQLLAAIMNTLFAAGTVPLVYTIERVGRRNVMMYSAAALTVCMVVFVAMIGMPNPTIGTQWTAVAAIFVYNTVFGYGWIGVCWLYGPEVCALLSYVMVRSKFNTHNRSLLLNSAMLALRLVPLANGFSHSLRCLLEVSLFRRLDGRSGFGWPCRVQWLFRLSTLCAQRYVRCLKIRCTPLICTCSDIRQNSGRD